MTTLNWYLKEKNLLTEKTTSWYNSTIYVYIYDVYI